MKSKLYFLYPLFILISIQTLFAQQQKADSLEYVLSRHSSNNTEKVDLMNEIAYALFSDDVQKTLKYTTESAQLSDQLNYTKGKATSLWIRGLSHINSDKQAATKYIQQSLEIAEDIKDQTLICNCLIAIGNIQKGFGDTYRSDESYEKALKIANSINDKNLILKCLVNIARNHTGKGEYQKAIEYLKKSIQLAQELNDSPILSKALNNLAWIYSTQSNHSVALEYYLKSLKINEQLRNQSSIIINHLNIAGIQSHQKEYEEALKHLNIALNISEEIGDSIKISMCLSTTGNIYIYMKMNDPRALEYYEKSLNIIGDNNITLAINILVNMATIYIQQEEFTKAHHHLDEAYHLAEKTGLKRAIGEIYSKVGLIYINQKRYSEALNYSKKSLVIADELKLLSLQKEVHGQLSEIYAATNNYQAAYQNHILV